MAFSHSSGVTDPLAPDSVIDWFATFEAWIVLAGWTVESGSGTTDLVISSVGEAAGYTKLFVHVRRDGVNPDRVLGDVRDDAVGTHQTTNVGYIDSAGVQFAYWMSADLDAIAIVFKTGPAYMLIYLGCLMPFALAPADETYYMVATDGMRWSRILRNHNGLWDQNITNYYDDQGDNIIACPLDGSKPLFALVANQGDEIAGEFRHISGRIADTVPVVPEDTITTGYPGATCDWIVLSTKRVSTWKFALRTGGALPVGTPDGAHFASQRGLTADPTDFITVVLAGFLTGIGWTDLGDAGVGTVSRLFYSQGESGTEDIYCIVSWGPTGNCYWDVYVQDDAAGTHRTPRAYTQMEAEWFPANYIVSGDLDCFVFVTQTASANYSPCWAGMVVPSNPNLPSSVYKVCTVAEQYDKFYLLRGHDAVWLKACVFAYGLYIFLTNSQPNLFDGTTYLVWPTWLRHTVPAGSDAVGMCKYLFRTGGRISEMDTITVGAQVYTVVFSGATAFAIRTT